MSNFIFSHSVFYLFDKLSATFIKVKIVVCKCFEYGLVLKSVIWERVNLLPANALSSDKSTILWSCKELTLSQVTNFKTSPYSKHLQTTKINVTNTKFYLGQVKNIVGKGENTGLIFQSHLKL